MHSTANCQIANTSPTPTKLREHEVGLLDGPVAPARLAAPAFWKLVVSMIARIMGSSVLAGAYIFNFLGIVQTVVILCFTLGS